MDLPPQQAAQVLVEARRSDPGWLDAFTEALARSRSGRELGRILEVWALSQAEAGRLFRVSRQAVGKWLAGSVPVDRRRALADLAAATDLLVRYVRRDRIPAVVRRPAPRLGGNSLLDLVAAGRTHDVLMACREMFDVTGVHH